MTARLTDLSGPSFRLLQLHLGGDRNFCYLLADPVSGAAAAVDPGFDPDGLAAIAAAHGMRIREILVTHGHFDHCAGVGRLAARTGATIRAGQADGIGRARPVEDGEEVEVGALRARALATPGHTPGHVCWLAEGQLFTGDLLFCGKVGGTGPQFPGSSAEAEWRSLRRLLELPDDTRVLPGHDFWGGAGDRPHSTIGSERRDNPFLLCRDFAAFLALKEGWAEYKLRHGLR